MTHIFAILISLLTASSFALAQEKAPLAHESEASVVTVSGNTESESYSAKQKTTYTFDSNLIGVTGRFLQSKSQGAETARSWDAALRYERAISDLFSIYLQHGAESDPFAGYTQRDNSDIGGKYYFRKTEPETFFAELGYRYTKTLYSRTDDIDYSSFARLYTEYSRQLTENTSAKLWVEYLPNLKESEAYLVNYEASATVMLNQIFSLKVAELIKYHNRTFAPGEKQQDATFTTSLVAKF